MAFGTMLALGGGAAILDALQGPGRRDDADRLAEQYRLAQEAANRKNEGRYGQLLRGQEGLARRDRKLLKGVGRQARADITRGHSGRLGDISRREVSSGLAGTTVGSTLRAGAEKERVSSLSRLEEGLSARRLGMEQGLQASRAGIIERRTDQGPDYGEMARIQQMRGQQGPFEGPAFGAFMQNAPLIYGMTAGRGGQQWQGPLDMYGNRAGTRY